MILLIDNYDSFVYNLLHYLQELGEDVEVRRNDAIDAAGVRELAPEAVVISPGPCDPDKAGNCLEIVRELGAELPMLGVCLGHQTIAQVFGGSIIRADVPMHGKTSKITHDGTGVFSDLPSPFTVTRYHSLVVDPSSVPACLEVNAQTEDGVIMGIRHTEHCLHGVQFHPESIVCEHGHDLLKNFLEAARG